MGYDKFSNKIRQKNFLIMKYYKIKSVIKEDNKNCIFIINLKLWRS